MPDDRLIHLCLGHSSKINTLTDFERLVWLIYKLASDDFGVMRFSAATLRDATDWLDAKPEKVVLRGLERVRDVGLIQTFTHQGKAYCYQHDWQTWQKMIYPRATRQPSPPMQTCDLNTQWLFTHHPDGGKLKSWKASEKVPGIIPETVQEPTPEDSTPVLVKVLVGSVSEGVCVGGGHRPRAITGSGVMGGALPREHLRHVWCGRVCVPDFLHGQFLRATNQSETTLKTFYAATFEAIPDDEPVEADALKFWRPMVTARWPPAGVSTSLKPEDLLFTDGASHVRR